MIGMPPATAASNCTIRLFCSASAKISLPYSANSFLLAVTTCLPCCKASSTNWRAKSVPPNNSATISTSGWRTTSKGSLVISVCGGQMLCAFSVSRLDTMKIFTSRPKRRLISAALFCNTSTAPLPTVPNPKIPILTGFILSPSLNIRQFQNYRIRCLDADELASPRPERYTLRK